MTRPAFRLPRAIATAAALLLGTALITSSVGCNNSIESNCQAECDCEGCTDAQYQNCVFEDEDDLRGAEVRGCDGYYDDYIDCKNATGVCVGNDYETSCNTEKDIYKDCIK